MHLFGYVTCHPESAQQILPEMAHLSSTRVRTIMKTADGVNYIGQDAVIVTTKATEYFIKSLVKEALTDVQAHRSKRLEYNNLVNVIHNLTRYEFLEIVIPKKITVREFKELMAKKNPELNGTKSDGEDSNSDSEHSARSESSH